jgi:hypothetical protein
MQSWFGIEGKASERKALRIEIRAKFASRAVISMPKKVGIRTMDDVSGYERSVDQFIAHRTRS